MVLRTARRHAILFPSLRGELAQLGERFNGIEEVSGSIPLFSIFLLRSLIRSSGSVLLEVGRVAQTNRTSLYWFRRSLRLDDNRALLAAVSSSEAVVPVFILDPAILTDASTGAARVRFLLESLTVLDGGLRACGGRLIIRCGQPVAEIERLVAETGASALYFSRDYEPYSRIRDAAVERACADAGIAVFTESDHLLSEPGEIVTQAGTPYTVFTPYRRVWSSLRPDSPLPAPERITVPEAVRSEALPSAPGAVGPLEIGGQKALARGGETAARAHLDRFLNEALAGYAVERDYPANPGTSQLSAYLKFGVISVRRIADEVRRRRAQSEAANGAEIFLSELCWRDFYYQILSNFPQVAEGAFRPAYNTIQWDNNEENFRAWCEGRTGYPFIDAAQRQLNREAWMHNRARMATASFLTKDLNCDWRWGERYFMQNLVDGDLAANNGGWQWAAGTGTDAQPYFRIFNPVTQGEKFDPNGDYVRRYVPELARVPVKFIHRPWELRRAEQEAIGCVIGRDYPRPIVDHAAAREKTLALYRAAAEGKG
jgi:deoxyribodipyrimidine photo-lyase